MLWQWALFITAFALTVLMPYQLLTSSTPVTLQSLNAKTLKALSYLLPAAIPLYLAGRASSTVRYYYRLSLYCTTLGLTSVWAVFLSIVCNLVGHGHSASIQHYVARSFYHLAGPILGVTLNVEGEEHLDTGGSTVYVGNHQS